MGFFTPKSFNVKILVETSARHLHLSQKDLETLFGAGYQLKILKQLTQPADFAAEETVDLKINSNTLKNLRIVGPVRENSQVELSRTDVLFLKVDAQVRLSGDISGTPGITLVGPRGEVNLEKGVIIAQRHIHCSIEEAKKFGLKNGAEVSVKINSERPVTFHNVKIRAREDYRLCMHLDTDEGNAAGINKTGQGTIL